jgi:hypothetical protein
VALHKNDPAEWAISPDLEKCFQEVAKAPSRQLAERYLKI